MKIYKSLLFIVACTATVAGLSFVFPKDGLTIGGATLRYANSDDFLVEPKEEIIDIHQEKQALTAANDIRRCIASREQNEYQARMLVLTASDYAIDFPENDINWLNSVFESLEKKGNKKQRILHYGDSQTEEDRMTSTFRAQFQKLFGGYGAGMAPANQTIPSSAISQRSYGNHKRYVAYGTKNMQHPQGYYGPMGQMIETFEPYATSFNAIHLNSTKANTKRFKRISVLYGNNKAATAITLKVQKKNDSIADYRDTIVLNERKSGINIATFDIPFVSNNATITTLDSCTIYAYMLDGDSRGVQVDNIPMRGCSGTIFTSINDSTLTPYFRTFDVPLIIMQYGGNSVPYLKGEKSIERYCQQLQYQINYMKRMNPRGKILFIGPSDMGTSINAKMQTYPELPMIVDKLKQMCLSNDVAYWDLYSAMGGYNSMIAWVETSPALAGSDHVHFTVRGAEKAAGLLCNHIEELYTYYSECKAKEEAAKKLKAQNDSILTAISLQDTTIHTTKQQQIEK